MMSTKSQIYIGEDLIEVLDYKENTFLDVITSGGTVRVTLYCPSSTELLIFLENCSYIFTYIAFFIDLRLFSIFCISCILIITNYPELIFPVQTQSH